MQGVHVFIFISLFHSIPANTLPSLFQYSLASLLNNCIQGIHLSDDCSYFIEKYPWNCDTVEGVFNHTTNLKYPLENPVGIALKSRLMLMMEKPGFRTTCLGKDPLSKAINSCDENLSLAIWARKEGQNWSQYYSKWCASLLSQMVQHNMLRILQQVSTEHPTCLYDYIEADPLNDIMQNAIVTGSTDMVAHLRNLGSNLNSRHLIWAHHLGYHDIIWWGITNSKVNFNQDTYVEIFTLFRIAVFHNKFQVCQKLLDLNILSTTGIQMLIDEAQDLGYQNASLDLLEILLKKAPVYDSFEDDLISDEE